LYFIKSLPFRNMLCSSCIHVLMNENDFSNNEEVVQFPLQETVEDKLWYPPEGIKLGEIVPTGNRIEYRDRDIGTRRPQFSKQSRDVILSKQKTGISGKYKTKGRNQNVSDRWESDSSNEESCICSDNTDNGHGGNLSHFVKGECEVGMWAPCENEVCNRHQKDKWHGNKKQDQVCKSPIPKPRRNKGENNPESCIPVASGIRVQVQVDQSQKKGPTDKWGGDQDQNLFQCLPDYHRDRREIMSQTYLCEVNNRRTQVQVDQSQKKSSTENWEGDQDQNLLQPVPDAQRDRRVMSGKYMLEASNKETEVQVDQDCNLSVHLPGPHTGRTESMSQGYMPEASDNRPRELVNWGLENRVAEIWKVHSDHIPVSLDTKKGRSQDLNQGREDRGSKNQICNTRNLLYCSDKRQMTDKDNEWNGNKGQGDIWIDSVSQDADIGRTKEEERQSKPEKRMNGHFCVQKPENSGLYMFTDYDSKVQNYLNKCINKIESSADVNQSSCCLQVPAAQLFNCNPGSIQNNEENVQMSTSCIRDALPHQTHNPSVCSPCSASELQRTANSPPTMTSTAGFFHGTNSLPTMVGISNQPRVQHVPDQAFESCSQPLPVPNIQELFEAFVREQVQQLMSMNQMIQMAVMNSTGLPNTNPTCLQNLQSDQKSQAHQINSLPVMTAPIDLRRGLPTNSSDLLLRSNNCSLNESLTAPPNPSLLRVNQVEMPRNILVQSAVSSSCNRDGNKVQMPNSVLYRSGILSPDASSFPLNHASQTDYPNIYTNNADNMPLNTPAFILNHGTQANHPTWISESGISLNYTMPQNYQSSQTYQPAAVGSMQSMEHASLDVYNQPLGVRPADNVTSNKMVIGKGRGRFRL
jgi:hypothetical protein